MPKEALKPIIFILYGLLEVVNVGRSVIILHILPVYRVCDADSPVVWLTMELIPSPDHNVFYF